jgi:glycosyltransferase involved in cell wall biosynthesis
VIDHDPHATIAQVRNDLARRASGEWLCFLDADDYLSPNYIEAMRAQYARIGSRYSVPPLLTPTVSYVRKGRAGPPRILPGSDLRLGNFLVVGTLVNRDLFLSVGGFSDYPHGFEDWSLWSKCWSAGAAIVAVKRAVYYAHINPRSKMRVSWRDKKMQAEMHERFRKELFPDYEPTVIPRRETLKRQRSRTRK